MDLLLATVPVLALLLVLVMALVLLCDLDLVPLPFLALRVINEALVLLRNTYGLVPVSVLVPVF